MSRVPPAYFDGLIDGFRRGAVGRRVHLGYWDRPEASDGRADAFARAQARLDDLLLEMADLRPGQRVLDAGCGLGGTLETINRRLHGMACAGVNIDLRQLELCRGIEPRNGNRLLWALADAARLPFAAASFDRVLCVEAMFHFPSRRVFFAEAARVLKPGGALVACDILLQRPSGDPGWPVEAALQAGFGPWPDPWGEDADHRRLALEAGLQCAAWRDAAPHTAPSHAYTAPAGDRRPGSPVALAALTLAWLHRTGHLCYPCMAFRKPG